MNKRLSLLVFVVAAVLMVGASVWSGGPQAAQQPCPTCPEVDLRSEACTVIMVGKDASTDGSVMTTHTCDCGVLRLDLPPHPGRRPQARRHAPDLPHRPVRTPCRPRSA